MPVATVLSRLSIYEMIFVWLYVASVLTVIGSSLGASSSCTGSSNAAGILCRYNLYLLLSASLVILVLLNWTSPHFWLMLFAVVLIHFYASMQIVFVTAAATKTVLDKIKFDKY